MKAHKRLSVELEGHVGARHPRTTAICRGGTLPGPPLPGETCRNASTIRSRISYAVFLLGRERPERKLSFQPRATTRQSATFERRGYKARHLIEDFLQAQAGSCNSNALRQNRPNFAAMHSAATVIGLIEDTPQVTRPDIRELAGDAAIDDDRLSGDELRFVAE